jgi:hypothetical protein
MIMGLDVTAYEKVELKAQDIGEDAAYELVHELDEQGIRDVTIYFSDDFIERAAPLVVPSAKGLACVYVSSGATHVFGAGSYGGHNRFREWLCDMAGIVAPRVQWADPDHYDLLPFHELVNFSDCEGVIGSAACAELAKDFADYQAKADVFNVSDSEHETAFFRRKYADWRKAFELAANGGCVQFH